MNNDEQKAKNIAEKDLKKLPLSHIRIALTHKGLLEVSQTIHFAICCFKSFSG